MQTTHKNLRIKMSARLRPRIAFSNLVKIPLPLNWKRDSLVRLAKGSTPLLKLDLKSSFFYFIFVLSPNVGRLHNEFRLRQGRVQVSAAFLFYLPFLLSTEILGLWYFL